MTNTSRRHDDLSPSAMMAAHVRMNLGVFFSDVAVADSLTVATSRTIPDFYWNYAYTNDGRQFERESLDQTVRAMKKVGRQPAIWQLAAQHVPSGWQVTTQEAWMWLDRDRQFATSGNTNLVFEQLESHAQPTPAMLDVFLEAYSSGVGDAGYFALPPEYGQAYMAAQPTPPASIQHFAGMIAGQCGAIASASLCDGVGGIYSVATRHALRRRGFGRAISSIAVDWLFLQGARGILLQTEAGSPVEAMYQSLGFETLHVGALLVPHDTR